jgi:iron complex transport system substrate-binding protein
VRKLIGVVAFGRQKNSLWLKRTLIGLLHLVLVAVISLVVACQGSEVSTTSGVVGTEFPLMVTDQAGRTVTINELPETIISLAPSSTEIAFALGLGDKIVGVTQYCNYPPEALDKPKIGGFSPTEVDVSMEQIVAINPDLILATETHLSEVVPKLEQFVPDSTILVLKTLTEDFDVVFDAINLVGECTGTEDEAAQIVAGMKQRIEAVTNKTGNLSDSERPRVLYIVWHDPIFAIGGGTLGNTLIEAAGGVNVFQDQAGAPVVDLETVIARNPQVILASGAMGAGLDLPYQFALNEDRLKVVDARINNRVYPVNDDLTGRPGPRIVEALEQLAKMIHPEIFGSLD